MIFYRKCRLCKKHFKTDRWNKMSCCAEHSKIYLRLKDRSDTELFKLSDNDLFWYYKIHGDNK